MNSAQTTKKKISEYQIEDIKEIFLNLLKKILNENKINTNRVAVCLPSDACYTRIIEIPEEVKEDESREFLENPDSEIQIPISLENSDFEIHRTNLPKK